MVTDDVGPLLEAIEGLRSDMREDLGAIRGEIGAVEKRVFDSVTSYTALHAAEHAENETAWRTDHSRYDDFIRSTELARAQRDGALGVVRFVFELVSRNAPALIRIVLAVAGALLVVNGNVSVSVQ